MSTCETVMVSPVQAKVLRQTADFSLQRPMNAVNIARLRSEMDAQRFVPGTPIYFAVLPDKSLRALNGQHTLEAISQGTGAVELTIIYQPVASEAEAGQIYARLDLHKVRSWRDSLRAYGIEDMISSSTIWTAAYAAAIGQIFLRFRNRSRDDRKDDLVIIQATRSRDVRAKMMRRWQDAADMYVAAVGPAAGKKQYFKRAAIFGVGLEIMYYQPSAGAEFFQSVAADDGLRVGDPQKALVTHLRESNSLGVAARDTQARATAVAWNAFFEKRRLEILRPSYMTDIRLAGTPWKEGFDPISEYLPELQKPSLRKIKTGVDAKGAPVAIHA